MPSAWNSLLGSVPSRPGVSSSLASVLGKAGTIFHLDTSMVFIPPMGKPRGHSRSWLLVDLQGARMNPARM